MVNYTFLSIQERKETLCMKPYMSPEMEMVDFIVETNIAADPMSIWNDAEFPW